MGKMVQQLLTRISSLFSNKVVEQVDNIPVFDERFKVILDLPLTDYNVVKVYAIHKLDVDVKFTDSKIFIGFVSTDDAFFFRITYSV